MTNPKPIPKESLELLGKIGEVKRVDHVADANSFIKAGAIIMAVSVIKPADEDDDPFSLLLGWPLEKGEPPWHDY